MAQMSRLLCPFIFLCVFCVQPTCVFMNARPFPVDSDLICLWLHLHVACLLLQSSLCFVCIALYVNVCVSTHVQVCVEMGAGGGSRTVWQGAVCSNQHHSHQGGAMCGGPIKHIAGTNTEPCSADDSMPPPLQHTLKHKHS